LTFEIKIINFPNYVLMFVLKKKHDDQNVGVSQLFKKISPIWQTNAEPVFSEFNQQNYEKK
jgi:hypothetical protein